MPAKTPILRASNMIPRKVDGDAFSPLATQKRLSWVQKILGLKLSAIPDEGFDLSKAKRNIENYLGTARIPIGLSGPICVNGQYAKGLFYVPMATTEGTVIDNYTRGMLAITAAGGAKTLIEKDELHISPSFELKQMEDAPQFFAWISEHFQEIKAAAESTTKHGKLLRIRPFFLTSDRVALQMSFFTEDAAGLTIVVLAAYTACEYIAQKCTLAKKFYLRSNLSSDKKASFFNYIEGYGKSVMATVDYPGEVLAHHLNATAEGMYDFWYQSIFGGLQSGMLGLNAHFANGLAAIYVATGQDLAHIVNAAAGVSIVQRLEEGGLRITVRLPSLVVGTLGGGTSLPTQRESLELMGCYGAGNVGKFAEIIAATLLAGETSICASLSSGSNFISAHLNKSRSE